MQLYMQRAILGGQNERIFFSFYVLTVDFLYKQHAKLPPQRSTTSWELGNDGKYLLIQDILSAPFFFYFKGESRASTITSSSSILMEVCIYP